MKWNKKMQKLKRKLNLTSRGSSSRASNQTNKNQIIHFQQKNDWKIRRV